MNIRNYIWVKILVLSLLLLFIVISSINFIADPYNLYRTNFFPNKPKEATQARLIKALELKQIKPISIVIGTSRADLGINPDHEYFQKPSYNSSIPGSSIYEIKFYVEEAIKLGNLKQILFVVDWRMFNDYMKKAEDFESYFNNFNPYRYLINLKSLEDSYFTIKNQKMKSIYLKNGFLEDSHMLISVKHFGGHLEFMKREDKFYYSFFPTANNLYKDTKKDSFSDFKNILKMCYDNNIKVDIVFGPSHIRQWEALNYYHDISVWYDWKKDVVLSVEKIAEEENKKAFRVFDFSVYHELTSEDVPTDPEKYMKYHWESSHYKKELGDIVLDRLLDISPYKDFGVELNIQNIDNHLQKLREDRIKFIDTNAYKKEVFGED